MTLDLNNPQSIAAWYRANPQRHAGFLRHILTRDAWAQVWPAIKASRELIPHRQPT